MIDYHELQKIVFELEQWVEYDGPTSLTEACELLMRLSAHPDYLSDEFYDALGKEIVLQLEMYKKFAEIVETEETFTRKVKEVVWK